MSSALPPVPVTREITLNNGVRMPTVGFGTFQVPAEHTAELVGSAFEAGYRHVDTAALYRNEAGVGAAVREATSEVGDFRLDREDVFVTTKLWNDRHDDARAALVQSRDALGLTTVDQYLIHWPVPSADRYVHAWRQLESLYHEGAVRSIGVSNFTVAQLERLLAETDVVPAVNQVELHPYLQQDELLAFHAAHRIATVAWSPLGRGACLHDAELASIAGPLGVSIAQLILRWHLQRGSVVIPKASSRARIEQNVDLFSFRLDDETMQRIAALDRSERGGPDPESVR
ncbi:aldo/keto reductase [Tersicoccus sp. Bi-70]|uniref:aldo/keto reductase n=1 Tax=Tersicoccus sp. Bi-70 TaxID=1897634 RepID=UPI000975D112|nr:aldo/keto reductase [Tersicoccus sp. Bi-70]OMH37237.1 oxidoreductase [Tersicoccus sp. Bi-70]